MRWSVRIFSAFGVPVRVHITFVFIVAYFAVAWGGLSQPGGWVGALYGVALVVLLFALVVVHELSHSRVAAGYGIKVRSITLLPIGGVSAMEEMPREPRKELMISIAGPLSNVVIALLMLLAVPFMGLGDLTQVGRIYDLMFTVGVKGAFVYLFVVNLSLAVFNLLPAFPMDGGRVFRAVLALRMPRPRASAIAIGVGRAFALLMGLAGILLGNVLLMLVAVFVYFGAQAEGASDRVDDTLGGLKVSQAVNTAVDLASPDQTIGQVAARLFHTYQEDFPVVGDGGELVGLLTRDRLIANLGRHGATYLVSEAMRTDFPVVTLEEPVYDAFMRMRTANCKAVPVVEHGRFVGMLSMEDISEMFSLLSAAGPDFVRWVPVSEEGSGPTTDEGDAVTWHAGSGGLDSADRGPAGPDSGPAKHGGSLADPGAADGPRLTAGR
ncbi:MAG: site-2 protease family protein [Actinobacteria bacterium]|nr:site-2 protease family protein [Actinomycetota bacterium]